nr:MAG TPA: INTERNALIN B BINDING, LEUCINE RICH REPEAT.2A [Caudoviricetes sp.]
MARTRYAVKMYFSDILSSQTKWGKLDKSYHPDYAFEKYDLYWNTGNGFRTDSCLNANGNKAFDKNIRNFYIGAGNPTEASAALLAGTTASSLIGVSGGIVDPYPHTQLSNYWTAVDGESFTECDRSVVSSAPALGYVSAAGQTGAYVSWKSCSSSTLVLPETGYAFSTSKPTAKERNGGAFIGWWHDDELLAALPTITGDYSVTAVFGCPFTLKFDANGGKGASVADKTCYGGVEAYSPQGSIQPNAYVRTGYVFCGWNTVALPSASSPGVAVTDGASVADIYAAAAPAAGATVTLYAQWRRPTVYIVNSDTSKGFLRLYKGYVSAANLVAEESGGVLMADVADGSYLVACANRNILYEGMGLGKADGTVDYPANPDGTGYASVALALSGAYEGVMLYAKRATHSVSIVVHVMDKNGQEITPTPATCTASVTSPTADETVDGTDRFLAGRSITVTGVAAPGYALTLARVGGDDYSGIRENRFTIPSLNADVTAHCYFTKTVYLLRAGIDAASASAIGQVMVDNGIAQEATYGDTVEYRATLATGVDAVFDGWFDGNALVSTANPYVHSVAGSVTLVAKAKVSVILNLHYGDNEHEQSCSLNVNESSYVLNTPFDVTLGSSFSFELFLGALASGGAEHWKLDSWYNANDTYRNNPLAYGTSGTISPTSNLSLVADVTSQVLVKTVKVLLKNDENQSAIVAANALTTYPVADVKDYDPITGEYTFSFNGSKQVRISSVETITVGETVLAFSGFNDSGVVHTEPDYLFFLTSANKSITSLYGSTGTRRITLGYGSANGVDGNRTMGTFSIVETDDPQGYISDDAQYADIHRGSHIVIVATPKNGYKFGGWYTTKEISGTAYLVGTTSTMVVTTDRSLYAWFVKDPNAVYEWEGGSDSKSLEWRSKTYVATRPFNPSCCRIDTEGYPVIEFDVDMFSAPDTAATSRSVITNVASQEARRLPVRRMERYLQVCVKNDHEVDAIFVGTNMAELAQ